MTSLMTKREPRNGLARVTIDVTTLVHLTTTSLDFIEFANYVAPPTTQ